MKEVSFFKEQEAQNKDYLDVCELLTYEYREEGEVLYRFGEPNDCMYIVIDGAVDCTVHMRDEVLTAHEIRELGHDVGMKNIATVFDKFKHQHRLFEGQQKDE